MAANLGNDHTYRFLLPDTAVDLWPMVTRLRTALSSLVGGDKVRSHCEFRRATQPVTGGMATYHLDVARLTRQQPELHLRIASYLDPHGWFGYVITPNSDSHGDLIMDAEHLTRSTTAFQRLWATGEAL